MGLAGCGEVTSVADSGAGECTTRTWQPIALANASFEDDGGWTIEPISNSAICDPGLFGISADSGTLAACFGAFNGADQTLAQAVELPPETTQVRLRGKRCLVTTEPVAVEKDTLIIEIQDADSLLTAASLASWSNLDAASVCAWRDFEQMAPVEGTPGSPFFYMGGVLDDQEITTFFIDTLQLDAFGC